MFHLQNRGTFKIYINKKYSCNFKKKMKLVNKYPEIIFTAQEGKKIGHLSHNFNVLMFYFIYF